MKKAWLFPFIAMAALALLAGASSGAAKTTTTLRPVGLRCEYAVDTLGVDATTPQLSWRLESDVRAQRQTAYEVMVTGALGTLWDSGRVLSDRTGEVAYAGKPLQSAQAVTWTVRVWDNNGAISPWSRPARWTMGLLRPSDWGAARWIGAGTGTAQAAPTDSLLLRRSLTVGPRLTRALAFACGLGQYELSVNGVKAGNDVLAPGWTKYDKTCLYDTRDITALLRPGANTVGLQTGNGMYNVHAGRYTKFVGSFGPQKAVCLIRLEYADRTVQTVVTDGEWRVSPGPITFSSVYGGEDYDARLLPAGWDRPGFDDSPWDRAAVMGGPGGTLRGLDSAGPPIRTFETFAPVAVKLLGPGVAVYDLGQNAAFMPRLTVTGPSGSVVRIIPTEMVHPDGSMDRASVGDGPAYWQYTLAGTGTEAYFPKFFYHGCRYFQVEASNPSGGALPTVKSLTGVVIGSDSPPIGQFTCSDPLFNRINTLIRWAQRSNMVSILTDCPHRERLGWLEEDHLNGPSLRYDFDLDQLFRKITPVMG